METSKVNLKRQKQAGLIHRFNKWVDKAVFDKTKRMNHDINEWNIKQRKKKNDQNRIPK